MLALSYVLFYCSGGVVRLYCMSEHVDHRSAFLLIKVAVLQPTGFKLT